MNENKNKGKPFSVNYVVFKGRLCISLDDIIMYISMQRKYTPNMTIDGVVDLLLDAREQWEY